MTPMECSTRVKARHVDAHNTAAPGDFMQLIYSSLTPWLIHLAEFGPAGDEIAFSRDLLAAVMRGEPGEEGIVQARLGHPRGTRQAMVILGVGEPGTRRFFALRDDTVSRFLQDTYALVPEGEEAACADPDQELADLLEDAA